MARRKVILAWGHSNMDGEGSLSDLATVGGTKWDSSGPYSNLVWYQNNVLDGLSTAGRLASLEFTASMFDGSPATAYDYPVLKTMPRATVYPQTFGPMLECQWQLNQDDDESYTVVQLGIAGSYLTRVEPSTIQGLPRDWWWAHATASWSPGLPKGPVYTATVNASGTSTGTTATTLTDGGAAWVANEHVGRYVQRGTSVALVTSNTGTELTFTAGWWPPPPVAPPGNGTYSIETRVFQAVSLLRILVEDYLVAANALMAPDTADVVAICPYIGTVDASEEDRANQCYEGMKAAIAYCREKIGQLGLCTVQPSQIPVALATDDISETVPFTYASTVAEAYQRIANEDPFVAVVDTTTGITRPDGTHPNGAGNYTIGQRFAQAIRDLRTRFASATTEAAQRLTLATIRERIKRRYVRNAQASDPTSQQILQYTNDSQREIINTLGDACWFTRRIESQTLTVDGTCVATLPYLVRRLVRLEDPSFPGRDIEWTGLGYTSGGRLQIKVTTPTGGAYVMHHMVTPNDLVLDTDTTIIPADYMELLEVLVCYRLSAASGNAMQMAFYREELERLWKYVRRDAHRYDRHRKAHLETLPDFASWNPDMQGD